MSRPSLIKNEDLTLEGPDDNGVYILTLIGPDKEHRFNQRSLDHLIEALKHPKLSNLDDDGAAALVITGGAGQKFFSNGFDLSYLMAGGGKVALENINELFKIMIHLPVPSVAAVNGHAYAGGAMLAMGCDYRVMNAEKGFFCTNELDIGLPFPRQMAQILKAKIPNALWTRVMLRGEKFSGKMCADYLMAEAAVPGAEVVAKATELAASLASKGADKRVYRAAKEAVFLEFLGGNEEKGLLNLDVTGVDQKVFAMMTAKASKM